MPNQRVIYPLEGDKYEEIRVKVYDGIGKTEWGELVIVRAKNPDVIHIGARRFDSHDVKPILNLTAVSGDLLFRTFGMGNQHGS